MWKLCVVKVDFLLDTRISREKQHNVLGNNHMCITLYSIG
jgi:hypothetical protein